MRTLRVVSEKSGQEVGRITMTAEGQIEADGLGADILDGVKRAKGWDDAAAFDALATGWSNGYVTIPAMAAA